jgi:hypothetical protein
VGLLSGLEQFWKEI